MGVKSKTLMIECIIISFLILVPVSLLSAFAVDSDGDYWDDEYESYIGTDPNNPDTDGDYIPDNEDPTPKGGLLNADELWDVYLVDATPSAVLVDEGSTIRLNFSVTELLPHGNKLPVDGLNATFKVFWGGYYGTLDQVELRTLEISSGFVTTEYIPTKSGMYYFILIVDDDDTMGAQTSRYEMDWLAAKGKGGYCSVAVYPHYYATVSTVYYNLLPGMTGEFNILFYEFNPSESVNLTARSSYSTSISLSASALQDLYEPSSGSVEVQVSRSGSASSYMIQVDNTALWQHEFNYIDYYTITVYSFDSSFSWDYTFSAKFVFSRDTVRVHNPEAIWYTVDSAEVFQNAALTVHRFSIDTQAMNASVFNSRYLETGSVKNIIEQYPSTAIPWTGTAYLYALYTVYDHSAEATYATLIADSQVAVNGTGTLNFIVPTPGDYRFACAFSGPIDYPKMNKFEFSYYYYNIHHLTYFRVRSPLRLYLDLGATEVFTGDSIDSIFNFNDTTAQFNIQSYLDTTKDTLLTPTVGKAQHRITTPTHGKHEFKGAIIFNVKTAELLDLFGIENFYGEWLASTEFQVYELAITADPPRTLIRGIRTQFRVLVQAGRDNPAAGANVKVTLTRYSNGRNQVFSGTCDDDGSIFVSFYPPEDNYNRMELTATSSTSSRTDTLETYISISDQDYQSIITLNKPLYHPDDLVMTRFLVYNKDTLSPAAGSAEVRLRDPYSRDIYRQSVSLDDYGCGNIEIPIGHKAPWGRYSITVYYDASQTGAIYFDVKKYTTPEVKITLQDAEAVQGENLTISSYVEYLFGQAVLDGEVKFDIRFQNEQPFDYRWYWYECDGIYRGSRSAIVDDWSYSSYEQYNTEDSYETTINVTAGWANVTVYVPYNINRIVVDVEFSDALEHEASDDHVYYAGAAPVEGITTRLTLTSPKSEWPVTEEPELNITLGYDYEDVYYPLANTEFSLKLIAKNEFGAVWGPWWYNGTTDATGTWTGTILELDISAQTLLKHGYYWLEFTAVAEAVEGGAKTASLELPIYQYVYRVSTQDNYFERGDTVDITLEQYDLLNDLGIPGDASMKITEKYYNSYYGSGIIYTKTMAVPQTGKIVVDWQVPAGISPGLYDVEVAFENATVHHTIQVLDYESNILTLSSSPTYTTGEKITVSGEFSAKYTGKIFIDAYSADRAHYYLRDIDASEFTIDIDEFSTRAPATIFVFYKDDGLYRSVSIYLTPVAPELELVLDLEKDTLAPGALMNITAGVLVDGKISTDTFLLGLVISDAGVYELVEDTMVDANMLLKYLTPTWLDRTHQSYRNLKDVLYIKQDGLSPVTEVHRIITKPSVWSGNYSDGDGLIDWEEVYFNGEVPAAGGYDSDNDDGMERKSLDEELEATDVREFFTETAYFEPGLVVNGKTKISFKLPDNIGGWRIKALATSLDLLGCYRIGSFNVSKPFFIDLKLPWPLRQDDMATFTLRVYNFAGKTLTPTVGLKKAGDWLQLLDGEEKTVTLAHGEVRDVKFLVNILGYDWQSITAIGSDFAGYTDAMVKSVYIRPNGALKVFHEAGVVEGSESLKLTFDPEILNASQKVTLRLAPGYSGLLMDGAGALASYSYGCTEQTMSALLPNVLIWEYLDTQGKLDYYTRIWLSRYIVMGIQQLYSYQHGNGGWGWWKADASEPWMTAYVLYGLARANRAGFYVDTSTISDAQSYITSVMDETGRIPASNWMKNDTLVSTAFAGFALAYSGAASAKAAIIALDTEYNAGKLSDPYVLTYYALAVMENGGDNSDILAKLADLRTGSHWDSERALGGNDEATGWAVYALATGGSGRYKAEIRGALEYLTALRRPWGGWATTSDTIASLHAVLAVLQTTEPTNMDVTVSVDGAAVKSVHVDESPGARQNFHSAMDAIDLTEHISITGDNNIKITASGTGDLFYELTAVEYLRTDAVISIPETVDCRALEETFFEVKVDPKNSEVVSMVDAEVLVPDSDDVTVLYVEESRPTLEDDVWVFSVFIMPHSSGTFELSPIAVSYRLDAGYGESGIIKRFLGPLTINSSQSALGNITAGTRSIIDDDVVLTKTLSKTIAKVGDIIEVTLELDGLDELDDAGEYYLVDHMVSAFKMTGRSSSGGNDYMEVIFDLGVNNNFTYSMKLTAPFNGQLPPAKLVHNELPLVLSNTVHFATSGAGDDITLLRTYSKSSALVGESVEVTLCVQATDTVDYAVVEDFIPASCNFDTTSLERAMDSDAELMDHTVTGNKVAFFVRSLASITITYRFTVADMVMTPVEPARAYGMYEPDIVGESAGKFFMSYQDSEDDWDISTGDADDATSGDGPSPDTTAADDEEGDIYTISFLPPLAVAVIVLVIILVFGVYIKRKHKGKQQKQEQKPPVGPKPPENEPGIGPK